MLVDPSKVSSKTPMLKGRLPRESISRVHHTMQSLLPWIFLLVLCPRSFSLDTPENVKAPKKLGKFESKITDATRMFTM